MNKQAEELPVFIIGHKNPDTDSICSAVAYAELKRKIGVNAVPVRCDEINQETKFVLDYFGVDIPEFIDNVYVRVEHIMSTDFKTIFPEQPLLEAGRGFYELDTNFFPVVTENYMLAGVVSTTDIAKRYIQQMAVTSSSQITTTLNNLLYCLDGMEIINSAGRQEITGNIVVCAMALDTLGRYVKKGSTVIIGNRTRAQKEAIKKGASVLIVTGALPIEEEIIEFAGDRGCAVISTPYDTFTAARLARPSVPIGDIMTKDVEYFYADDAVRDIKDDIVASSHRAYPVIDEQGKVEGIISYADFLHFNPLNVILVDHNEKSQAVVGIEEAEILEVIDHHRIGDIQTLSPIYMRNEPLGSTGTVIYKMFKEHEIRIDSTTAGLLLSAILSDTVLLKSPTVTYEDRKAAENLADIAGCSIELWGMKLIKNRTSWEKVSSEEMLTKDLKQYIMGGKTVGVAQIEVLNSGEFNQFIGDIQKTIEGVEREGKFDIFFFMVTDILKEGTLLIFNSENKRIVDKAFEVQSKEGRIFLEGVMSRKKQVVPYLNKILD